MADTMKTLADNYIVGIAVTAGIIILIYVAVSIFTLLRRRKYKGDISLLCMIPLVNVVVFFLAKKGTKSKVETTPEEEALAVDDIF
jgi:hypothetical protein